MTQTTLLLPLFMSQADEGLSATIKRQKYDVYFRWTHLRNVLTLRNIKMACLALRFERLESSHD